MGGLLHLVQRGWDMCLLAAPNVTAHPSTASVPIAVLLYNAPLLCGFNVPIKGLIGIRKLTDQLLPVTVKTSTTSRSLNL